MQETDSILGLGRSSGGGHSNPLHYSCLENSMDRGSWWATVYGVIKELDTTYWLNKYILTDLLSYIYTEMHTHTVLFLQIFYQTICTVLQFAFLHKIYCRYLYIINHIDARFFLLAVYYLTLYIVHIYLTIIILLGFSLFPVFTVPGLQ